MAKRADITPELCRQLLRYEPETGKLFWRNRARDMFATDRAFASWTARYPGREAFTNTIPGGYKTGTILNSSHRAHRVIWAIVHGTWPISEIDHINGIRTDNRLANLRLVTSSENSRNCRRYSNNTSGHTGIYWYARRRNWIVKVAVEVGKHREIGKFRTLKEALAARDAAWAERGYSERHGSTEVTP